MGVENLGAFAKDHSLFVLHFQQIMYLMAIIQDI